MRIGFIHPTRLKGGGERLAATLMNGLSERGFEVALAGLKHPGFELNPKIKWFSPSHNLPKRFFIYLFVVLKMLLQFKPNILFFSRIFGLSASLTGLLCTFTPFPRINYVNVNPYQGIRMNSQSNKGRKFLARFFAYLDLLFAKYALKRTKINLCNSEHIRNLLKKWISNVEVANPPVDLEKFKPDWKKKENSIVYVSRFAPEKKQDLALKIFSKLNKNSNYKLYLVGHPSYGIFFRKCQELSTQIPGSQIIADVTETELIDFYQKASVLWFLRKNEPFGMVPVEGMACGAIPIAFKGGGLSETVIDNESGFLCDNIGELLSKTKFALENRKIREKVSRAAVKRASFYRKELFVKKCESAIKTISNSFKHH